MSGGQLKTEKIETSWWITKAFQIEQKKIGWKRKSFSKHLTNAEFSFPLAKSPQCIVSNFPYSMSHLIKLLCKELDPVLYKLYSRLTTAVWVPYLIWSFQSQPPAWYKTYNLEILERIKNISDKWGTCRIWSNTNTIGVHF